MCEWQTVGGPADCSTCPYDGDCTEQRKDAEWDNDTFDEQDKELNITMDWYKRTFE